MSENVWLIVGASSGFGRAIALEALSRGDKVAAASRDTSKLTDLECAGAMALQLDVTGDEAEVMATMQKAVDKYGRITHCVNAAGYLLEGVIEAACQEEVRRIIATNVMGTATVTRCALRFLRPQGSGVIANFGSLASWEGGLAYGYYVRASPHLRSSVESRTFSGRNITNGRPYGEVCVVNNQVGGLWIHRVGELGMPTTRNRSGGHRAGILPDQMNDDGSHRLLAREQLESEYAAAGLTAQKEAIIHMDDKQPGDVVKGARVIVDVLTQTGVGSSREIPVRLVLGSDALRGIRNKIKITEKLLEEWEDVIVSTDYIR